MKPIKFSEKQIELLREQYTDELSSAEEYVEQIKEILNKLGVSTKGGIAVSVEKETKKDKKKELKHKNKISEITEPKKRGRKPKVVSDFVETALISEPVIIKEVKARGRKPKVVAPMEALPIKAINPVVIVERKKREPKLKKEIGSKVEKKPIVRRTRKPKVGTSQQNEITPKQEVKVDKKPVSKRTPKSKPNSELIAKVEIVQEPITSPKSEQKVNPDIKKKRVQKRNPKGRVTLVNLSKRLPNKEPKTEPTNEIPPKEDGSKI